jgi:hypothetical protein
MPIQSGDLVQCIETNLIGICISKTKIGSEFGNKGKPFTLYNIYFSNGNLTPRTETNLISIEKIGPKYTTKEKK